MALFAEFFGGRPKVPDFVPVDVQAEQNKATAGNLAQMPNVTKTANLLNEAQFSGVDKALEQASGGWWKRLNEKNLSNINDLLSGGDLTDVLRGTSAANLARGTAYGGFGQYTKARNTAMAALGNRMAGAQALERWMGNTYSAFQPVNVSQLFAANAISPQFQAQFAAEERNAKFQRDYIENQWDWYDSFGQKAVRFEDSLVSLASSIGGAAAGMCWVAREVYGADNPKWLQFRGWLLTQAPKWLVKLYRKYGERVARFIANKPALKRIIRNWMDARIATMKGVEYEFV